MPASRLQLAALNSFLAAALVTAALPARAQLTLSANDGKFPNFDGTYRVLENPPPDSLTVLDVSKFPFRVKATIEVQHSVAAPPMAVALAHNEKLALVGVPNRVDPNDKTKVQVEPHIQIVDLVATPSRVERLALPHHPIGVSINKAGTSALAAHYEGLISVLKIDGKSVSLVESIRVGDEKSRVSAVVFTPDGKWALATKRGEDVVSLLKVDGTKVTYNKRDLTVGNNPYGLDIAPNGKFAVVANIGRGTGDSDSVSIIDMAREPFRTIGHFAVGQTPEGIVVSPDSKHVAVAIINGRNKPKDNPFRHETG